MLCGLGIYMYEMLASSVVLLKGASYQMDKGCSRKASRVAMWRNVTFRATKGRPTWLRTRCGARGERVDNRWRCGEMQRLVPQRVDLPG